jgi:hypothetical protein
VRSTPYNTARRELGDEFPEILELGRKGGTTAFLGRRRGGDVALLLVQPTRARPEYLLQVVDSLESGFPVGRTTCAACGTPQAGWPRFCDACRADLAGAEPDGAPPVPPGGYELLGSLRREDGGGPLYFAREAATGRVVGLSGRRGLAGGLELAPSWTPAVATGRRGAQAAAAAGVLAVLVLALALGASRREQGAAAGPSTRLAPRPVTGTAVRGEPPAAVAPGRGNTVQPRTANAAGNRGTAGTVPSGGSPAPPRPGASPTAGTEGRGQTGAPPTEDAVPASRRPAASEPPAVPTPQGVEEALHRYTSAVGSGRTSRIAGAYPGITPAEVDRWERFFAPIRPDAGLRAWYEVVSGPSLHGDRAEVIFTLTIAYENATGDAVERPLPLRARLRWTGSAWALQEVLLLQ